MPDEKKVIETALKSLEKVRKDMMEVVIFASKGDKEKEAQKLLNEIQKIEASFQKLFKGK